MKLFRLRLLAVTLCLVLLCGCMAQQGNVSNNTPNAGNSVSQTDTQQQDNTQQDNTAPDTGDTNTDEEESAPQLSFTELTTEELTEWEGYFNQMENNGLLRFPYANPAENPDQLAPYLHWLFYDNGEPESEFSEDELSRLTKTDLWLELDAFRLSRDFMNRYLYEHMNIPAERTENLFDAAQLGVYLLQYDAWYISHGDTEYQPYAFDRGEQYEDGTVKLYYTHDFLRVVQENGEMDYVDAEMVVTLAPRTDGTWYIVAHEIANEQ